MDNRSRRRSTRIPSCLSVQWIRRGVAHPAVAADINADGLFIQTDLDAQPGELLQLVIDLSDGPLLAFVTARFVGASLSGRGIGAELFLLGKTERRRWNRHYRAQLQVLQYEAPPAAEHVA